VNTDTAAASINRFKGEVFMYEIIITVIVFAAVYYVLQQFKKKETKAKEVNDKYNNNLG
jgi:H+/gluconate symporter-like permease